jgi:pimeloyl-ACP methyl ester carboxylesterase
VSAAAGRLPAPIAIEANGITLSTMLAGDGPPVVFVHGFPELGYSWRHQVVALADAGYTTITPDMRGYGASSIPGEVDAYDVVTLAADLVGLLDALGLEQAAFVGHDWGAAVVWQLALLEPERVGAVAALSVPFAPRPPAPPMEIIRRRHGEDHYLCWFQNPAAAAALERDVRRTLLAREPQTREWCERDEPAAAPPPWLDAHDLGVYVRAFERTGFAGGLSYYRNIDRNWSLTAPLDGQRVLQPALFMTGSRDLVSEVMSTEGLAEWVPGLRSFSVVEGAGHWLQQERPELVNRELLAFLGSLG